MGIGDALKRWDLYKKIPEDLTVSTAPGAYLSLGGVFIMFLLFILEFNAYLTPQYETRIVMDENKMDETLKINFNVTIPDLRCEHATLDVSDSTGFRRHNLTQNIMKIRQDHKGRMLGLVDPFMPHPEYIDSDIPDEHLDETSVSQELTEENFQAFLKEHHLVMVDFYAPWCIWCQRLTPIWEKTAQALPKLHYGQYVRMAEVNCVDHPALCQQLHIRAYPTIYFFRNGDMNPMEMYHGDRKVEAFLEKAKSIIDGEHDHGETIKRQLHQADRRKEMAAGVRPGDVAAMGPEGCQIVGSLTVKKVPGNFHIHLSNPHYSVDTRLVNGSHVIGRLWLGEELDKKQLARLPKSVRQEVQTHSLENKAFISYNENNTYVHYLKVISYSYKSGGDSIDVYRYIAHSNEYFEEFDDPSVMFRYDLSPMAVQVVQKDVPFYHFVTSVCAIIGGVFTVIGLLDSLIFQTRKALNKKQM